MNMLSCSFFRKNMYQENYKLYREKFLEQLDVFKHKLLDKKMLGYK